MAIRHIYLKIETVEDYSPVKPMDKEFPPLRYGRDCMRNPGHLDTKIPQSEIDSRRVNAVVYREYWDAGYLIPKTHKLVEADINEPIYNRRIPGTIIYTYPGQKLKVHVLNCHNVAHSLHVHGLVYGVDSDGAWPFGTEAADGRRSDEICPGQSWTYTFEVAKDSIGVWPFHDHAQMPSKWIDLGLFGGIVVVPNAREMPPEPKPPKQLVKLIKEVEGININVVRDELHPIDVVRNNVVEVDRDRFILGEPPRLEARLREVDRIRVRDEMEFIDELLLADRLNDLVLKPRPKLLHVPVFFHQLKGGESIPLFDSGDIEEMTGFWEHTFSDLGDFDYFCTFHPVMTGTVQVQAGAPGSVTVNILDGPMRFSPDVVQVAPGGTVRWNNLSVQHHTVTSADGGNIPSHCINGRSFIGNSPTIQAVSGQRIRWYVFNLDIGHEWHNFHLHAQRWEFAGEQIDTRSMGPAESFQVDTVAPPVLLLDEQLERWQKPNSRPRGAKQYTLMGEFIFHCHVHHHFMNGMGGMVRAFQRVWLTPKKLKELLAGGHVKLATKDNLCPKVDVNRCKQTGDGKWEEIVGDPEVAHMHSALLPNSNKVLYWGYTRADQSRLWDYSTPAGSYGSPANQPASLPGHDLNSSNLWSAEHSFLDTPEGHLLVNGGFTPDKAFTFDPTTDSWAEVGATADARFYSTTLTRHDGKAMTFFGSASKTFEVYDPNTQTWAAPVNFPASFNHHVYYPWAYQLPDGQYFIAGPHVPTQRFNEALTNIEAFNTNVGDRSSSGEKGTSVLLTLRPPFYEPKVMIMGGNLPGSEKSAEMIDLSVGAPAWSNLPDLNVARPQQFTSVLMPDGRVFIAGGIAGGPDGGPCEIFDPLNPGSWKLGPVMKYARLYHSTIILLADGSILAGGDPQAGGHTPHERYFPGYMFVPRPQINAAPATANYGDVITVTTPQAAAVAEGILMRPGAATHGFNMSQRAIEIELAANTASTVDFQIPTNTNVLPPGHYLLFILDNNRIPSEGHWIRITP